MANKTVVYDEERKQFSLEEGEGGGGLQWSDTSFMPEADKVVRFSEQGLVSTGTPLFPENAVPLSYLDIRLPEPPASGSFILMSEDGVLTWIPN